MEWSVANFHECLRGYIAHVRGENDATVTEVERRFLCVV